MYMMFIEEDMIFNKIRFLKISQPFQESIIDSLLPASHM